MTYRALRRSYMTKGFALFISRYKYQTARIVMRNVTPITASLTSRLLLLVVVVDESRITPKYTVINCFGRERIAAMEKTMMPIPHVENIAVVTMKNINKEIIEADNRYSQWPGIALRRAMSAILNPPSRITRARQAYHILVFSIFTPRALQQYLNALCMYVSGVAERTKTMKRTRSCQFHPRRCQRRRFQIQSTIPIRAHTTLQQFRVQIAREKG